MEIMCKFFLHTIQSCQSVSGTLKVDNNSHNAVWIVVNLWLIINASEQFWTGK